MSITIPHDALPRRRMRRRLAVRGYPLCPSRISPGLDCYSSGLVYTLSRRERAIGFASALPPHHRIPQRPDPINLNLPDIPRLEPDGGLAGHADAGGGAGEDQVAGFESEDLREV